jgi:hypothetical protein
MLAKRFQQCIKGTVNYEMGILSGYKVSSKFENSLQKDNDMNYSIDEKKALTQFCAGMW